MRDPAAAARARRAIGALKSALEQLDPDDHARNPRVIGSVLRGEDTDDSDLDLLVDPMPGMTLFDVGAIGHELAELLGVPVNAVTPGGLPDHFRTQVLAEAREV